jgi:hypothetical protein
MVKVISNIILTLLLFLLSFTNTAIDEVKDESQVTAVDEMEFDYSKYNLDRFTERMQLFLNEKSLKFNSKIRSIMVLNSEGCAKCIKEQFVGYINQISQLKSPILVLSNDSSFISDSKGHDDDIQFEVISLDLFREYEVVHKNIYLYQAKNGKLVSTVLLTKDLFHN